MRLAFISRKGTFAVDQIGGTDSYMRRLTNAILSKYPDIKIDWIFYPSSTRGLFEQNSKFRVINEFSFKSILISFIRKNTYDHFVFCQLHPFERVILLRDQIVGSTIHNLEFFYPENKFQRFIKFLPYSIPREGKLFLVSNRQVRYCNSYPVKTCLILPIVPRFYYLPHSAKNFNHLLRVKFIGRLDPRKGIFEVLEIFKYLAGDPRFEISINGIYISDDEIGPLLNRKLRNDERFNYYPSPRGSYTPLVEDNLIKQLHNTDVFLQPYRTLDSTLDTPLLIMEAMASSCAILSTLIGTIPEICGESPFLLNSQNFVANALDILLDKGFQKIAIEQSRVGMRANSIFPNCKITAQEFINGLSK